MKKSRIAPYLYILPNLIIFSVFVIIPAFVGLYYSFMKYDGLNKARFIGLKNYIKLFHDSQFINVVNRTIIYTISVVVLIYVVSLGLALILTTLKKSLNTIRVIYYLPVMISFVIAGLTWQWFLSDHFGLMNYILSLFGIKDFSFLLSKFGSNLSAVMVTVWARFGYFMVIFFVALISIDKCLYEAAEIDGVSKVQKFLYITFPMLKPTTILVLILSLIDTLKTYPLIVSLTGGGPVKATTYIVQNIYETGFISNKLGYASSMSVLLFIVVAIISAIIMKVSNGGEIS
jgi:alpha-1,4-digalacturonate transport system permease protein